MKVVSINSSGTSCINTTRLIEGCKEGDPNAQEELYRTYAPRVMTTCRRYEHPSFGASDILQETFITVYKRISTYDPEKGSLEAWIKRIAINIALKLIRKRKIDYSDIEISEIDQVENESIQDVETIAEEIIMATIKDLPDGYRTVFNMYIIDGFTHAEIADYLQISVQTSKSQLFKAKREIRKKIGLIPSPKPKKKMKSNSQDSQLP